VQILKQLDRRLCHSIFKQEKEINLMLRFFLSKPIEYLMMNLQMAVTMGQVWD
jgi:hypothetical protein